MHEANPCAQLYNFKMTPDYPGIHVVVYFSTKALHSKLIGVRSHAYQSKLCGVKVWRPQYWLGVFHGLQSIHWPSTWLSRSGYPDSVNRQAASLPHRSVYPLGHTTHHLHMFSIGQDKEENNCWQRTQALDMLCPYLGVHRCSSELWLLNWDLPSGWGSLKRNERRKSNTGHFLQRRIKIKNIADWNGVLVVRFKSPDDSFTLKKRRFGRSFLRCVQRHYYRVGSHLKFQTAENETFQSVPELSGTYRSSFNVKSISSMTS